MAHLNEHGNFKISINSQTIILEAYGAWNYETAIRFCHDFKQSVKKIESKPWASLIDLREWDLSTPDIWEAIDDLTIWSEQHNQRYEATIYINNIQKTLLEQSQQNFENISVQYFDQPELAYQWLANMNMLKPD